MTTPIVVGGLGIGQDIGLGGPQPAQSFALPAMSKTAIPYIAHLYDHSLVFKRTLGGATIIKKPGLKLTQNGGYQQFTLEVATPVTGLVLGDVIRLSEQGDNAGTILVSGNVETTPEQVGVDGTHHLIVVTPWIAELGDAFFDHQYITPTLAAPADATRAFTQGPIDVAQFVRDAVAGTAHCSVSPISCPNSGVTATYDFQNTNALDAIHVAKQIAGANWWYGVDAQGVVWFQPIVTANPPTITLRKGVDYNSKNASATVTGMKNKIPVIGGSNPGDPGRISSLYDGVTNQRLYGVRAFNPTPSYPTVTAQTTLDAIAASLGAQFDRVLNSVELDCPALGTRLIPWRAGGLSVRFWESSKESLQETGLGTGGYSSTFILQDVEVNGPSQKLIVGDIPYADLDTTYEATRIAQRTAVIAATAGSTATVQPPPVAPSPTAAVTQIAAKATTGGHLYALGAGTITICTASFTTSAAGTVQLVGALDCRMEAWDSNPGFVRNVYCEIVGGALGTTGRGVVSQMPFGLTRVTKDDGNTINTLALPAGSYTVRWIGVMVGYCQLRVYSGYAQAVTTI